MKLYTINQVCSMLGISVQTFYNWKKKGKVKTLKLSEGVVRVTQQELERLLKGDN